MAKGFGKPTAVPTRDATRFMVAFGKCYSEAKGDKEKIYQFLKANVKKLDESLLDALPLVFKKLIEEDKLGNRENAAKLFGIFGFHIKEFPLGNRACNLELSITACQISLKFLNYKDSPQKWALTQNNLGNAYAMRIQGDRSENLEKAIKAYTSVVKSFTSDEFTKILSTVQYNLGMAYRDRIIGKRAENLEKSIVAAERSLQMRDRNNEPKDWANSQNNLGLSYRDRIRGDRADNLEKAITCFKLSLQIITFEDYPLEWAGMQNNLGLVYRERILGNRSENIEKAISALDASLKYFNRDTSPEDWARSKHNMADIYLNHTTSKAANNLAKAIQYYKEAAEVFTRDDFPLKWAQNQGHLAEALIKRSEFTKNSQDLDKAVTLLQEALNVAVPGSPDYIYSQYRLGTALSRRFEQNHNSEDLKQALQAYKTALDAISPEHYDREKIWQALPTTQTVLGSRLVREGQWQEGMQLLLNSVRLLRDSDDSLAHANALYETGRAHEVLADWSNARLYYRDALRLFEHLNDLPGIAKSRHGLGSVLASQGYFQKGMTELEKARELYQQLNRPDRVAEVDALYQTTQRAEHNLSEVAV